MQGLRPHERWRRTHRLACWAHGRGVRGLPGWLVRRNRRRFGLDLPPHVGDLDYVYLMHNGLGTVISPHARIAGLGILFHEVTLECRSPGPWANPMVRPAWGGG